MNADGYLDRLNSAADAARTELENQPTVAVCKEAGLQEAVLLPGGQRPAGHADVADARVGRQDDLREVTVTRVQ